MVNVFDEVALDETDNKKIIARQLRALRKSVEANIRQLRHHTDDLRLIKETYGINGTEPLFSTEETVLINQTLGYFVVGGADALLDGLPFEGIQLIVNDVLEIAGG